MRRVYSPQAQAERLKEAQQIEHISSLQRFAREILDSVDAVSYPADIHSWDDLEQTQNSLWRVFKRITSDARWPRLAAHLGDHVFDIYDMTKGLEPAKLKAAREKLGSIVYVRHSTDDVIGVIDEAYELISRSSLNLIAEEADTEEWERCGLERWCPWCPNPVSDK